MPAFQPVDVSNFVKIKNTFLYICVYQKLFVILQRKMNRALVAEKVLQYLAHAEGICLSGGVNTGHIEKGVLRALFWLTGIW